MDNELPKQPESLEYRPLDRDEIVELPRSTKIRLLNEDGTEREFWKVVNSKSPQGEEQVLLQSPVLEPARLSMVLEEYYKRLANLANYAEFAKDQDELDREFFVGYREDPTERRSETSLRHWDSIDYDRMVARKARLTSDRGVDHHEAIRLANGLVNWWTKIGAKQLDEDYAKRIRGDREVFDPAVGVAHTKQFFENYISSTLTELGVENDEVSWTGQEPSGELLSSLDGVAPIEGLPATEPAIESSREGEASAGVAAGRSKGPYRPNMRAVKRLSREVEKEQVGDRVEQQLAAVFEKYYAKSDEKKLVSAYDKAYRSELNRLKGVFLDAKKDTPDLDYEQFSERYIADMAERLSAVVLVKLEQDALVTQSDANYYKFAKERLENHLETVKNRSAYTEVQKKFKQSEVDRLTQELQELNHNYGDVNLNIANIRERVRNTEVGYWSFNEEGHVSVLEAEAKTQLAHLELCLGMLSDAFADEVSDRRNTGVLGAYRRFYELEEKINSVDIRIKTLLETEATDNLSQLVNDFVDARHDAQVVIVEAADIIGHDLTGAVPGESLEEPLPYNVLHYKKEKTQSGQRVRQYLTKRNWLNLVLDAGLAVTVLAGVPTVEHAHDLRIQNDFRLAEARQELADQYGFNEMVASHPELSRMREGGKPREEIAEMAATRSIADLLYAEGTSEETPLLSGAEAHQRYTELMAARIVLGEKAFNALAEKYYAISSDHSGDLLMSDLAKLVGRMEASERLRAEAGQAKSSEITPGNLETHWSGKWQDWAEKITHANTLDDVERLAYLESVLSPLADKLTTEYNILSAEQRYLVAKHLFDAGNSNHPYGLADDQLISNVQRYNGLGLDVEHPSAIQKNVATWMEATRARIDRAA